MKVAVTALSVPWRAPLVAAHGAGAGGRPLLLLELTGADGVSGYGEAAPLEGYDGVSIDSARAGLDRCSGLLRGSDGDDREELLEACAERAEAPGEALAAIDMALWDLAGRRAGKPVWELVRSAGRISALCLHKFDPRGGGLAVNATIGAEAPSSAGREAGVAVAAGFRCVKVKVGTGSEDLARVAAVREAAGPDVAIRVDANGAWSVGEAVDALASLEGFGIELCEEPVHGLEAIAEVARRSRVPIALDESARDPGWRSSRVCEAICLKVARCGGIGGVVRDAVAARRAGYRVYVASTLDGVLGIAAALHASLVIAPDYACGLATLDRFERVAPFAPEGGRMAPPPGPGLGDGLVDWYQDPFFGR